MEGELEFNNKTGLQKTQDTYFIKMNATHTLTHTGVERGKTGGVR